MIRSASVIMIQFTVEAEHAERVPAGTVRTKDEDKLNTGFIF